jgi:hypothetical protein
VALRSIPRYARMRIDLARSRDSADRAEVPKLCRQRDGFGPLAVTPTTPRRWRHDMRLLQHQDQHPQPRLIAAKLWSFSFLLGLLHGEKMSGRDSLPEYVTR